MTPEERIDKILIEYDMGKQPSFPGDPTAIKAITNSNNIERSRKYAKASLLQMLKEARVDQDKHSRGDEFLWFVRKIREYDFDEDVIEQNLIQPNEGKYRAYFEAQDRLAKLNPKEKTTNE